MPFELIHRFLSELDTALWELHARILVDKRFMQLAKVPVLPLDYPISDRIRVVELYLYDILGISPMVIRILEQERVIDRALKSHLEEMRPREVVQIL